MDESFETSLIYLLISNSDSFISVSKFKSEVSKFLRISFVFFNVNQRRIISVDVLLKLQKPAEEVLISPSLQPVLDFLESLADLEDPGTGQMFQS